MSVVVHTAKFEGPMALLLHLIRREEMDIFDINVHAITKQYLEYIKSMKKLNLEVAGEFIAMAATLIHIKSRMLLPNYDENGEELEDADPRKELVQRLLEYQAFQDVSKQLYERPLLNRDTWVRGRREVFEVATIEGNDDIEIEENPLFGLISAYRMAVRNMTKAVHNVTAELQNIGERILEMKERFITGQTMLFSKLIDRKGQERSGQVLITFLSLLELAKLGFVSLFQSANFSEIHIEAIKEIDGNALERVESYEKPQDNETNLEFALEGNEFTEAPEDLPEDDAHDEVEQPVALMSTDRPEEVVTELMAAVPENVFIGDAPVSEESASDDDILAEEERLGLLHNAPEKDAEL